MRRWMTGWLLLAAATGVQAADGGLNELEAQGKELFEIRCGICHQLPEPDMLTAAKWKRLLQLMQKRMQQVDMLPLNEEEFAQIHAYLSSQARRK